MMNRKSIGLVMALCYLAHGVSAQSPQWWADNVGWDGSRPYQYYIKMSPEGMGPNALPVPAMHRFLWDTTSLFQAKLTGISHPGEVTLATDLALRWQPASWFRLGVQVIPLEYYETSHEVKERRKIFWEAYDDRIAGGDFYIESAIKLPPRWMGGLHSELRIGMKAPSGTHLGAARYTDTPGYYFDMAFAGVIGRRHTWESMLGFYVYQTYEDRSRQNDTFLWGLGHRWDMGNAYFFHHLRGYAGYLRNGDIPVIYEVEFGLRRGKDWSYLLLAGHGLNHYPFTYISLGIRWHFVLQIRE